MISPLSAASPDCIIAQESQKDRLLPSCDIHVSEDVSGGAHRVVDRIVELLKNAAHEGQMQAKTSKHFLLMAQHDFNSIKQTLNVGP